MVAVAAAGLFGVGCAHAPASWVCPASCTTGPPPVTGASPRIAAVHPLAAIHRVGTHLVGPDGRPIALRGVDLGGWMLWEGWEFGARMSILHLPGEAMSAIGDGLGRIVGRGAACAFQDQVYRRFITERDIAAIAALGLNVVRVPLNYRAFDCPNGPGWARLDALLGWCAKYHVYAVLDLHAAPGGQSSLFTADPERTLLWASKAKADRTVAIWEAIAARYAGRRIVAGYDLLNEPDPPSGKALVALYRRIIAGIRKVDQGHLVILEGSGFATDFSMFHRRLDPNEMYSFHMYTWFGDHRETSLARYARIAREEQVPFWCGEFGQNTYASVDGTLRRLAGARPAVAGWAMWTWKQTRGRYPALNTIHPPPAWKRLIDHLVDGDGPAPSKAAAQEAMEGFLDAAAYERTSHDPRLREILSRYATAPVSSRCAGGGCR